ncbi:hypothetical protein O181_022795 [Austropuccinia psidii MF-1]|uniref:Uncharacterized protein n=1 Tax=Austropuccinia psidii MF-1 TaxID=1389203 RepID=A0A9Q3CHC4_9BASI|nr:hypothetical protein [Austropuccinia psidii MF-1]
MNPLTLKVLLLGLLPQILNMPLHPLNPVNQKRYDWIPENIPPPQEIHGDFGDPRNIIDKPRKRNQVNITSNLPNNPQTLRQFMEKEEKPLWKEAINRKLDKIKKHHMWSPSQDTNGENAYPPPGYSKRKPMRMVS